MKATRLMSWFSPAAPAPARSRAGFRPEAEPDVHRSLALAALFEEIRRRKLTGAGPRLGRRLERRVPLPVRLQAVHRGPLRRPLVPRPTGSEASSRAPASSPSSSRCPRIPASTWSSPGTSSTTSTARSSPPSPSSSGSYTDRGALLFALISYHKTIPAQPYRFRIKDEQHLIYERRTGADRPSPRLAPAEVTGLLKGFRVDRSFLLKHGIQEYLLVRE